MTTSAYLPAFLREYSEQFALYGFGPVGCAASNLKDVVGVYTTIVAKFER